MRKKAVTQYDQEAIASKVVEKLQSCSWPCGMSAEVIRDLVEIRQAYSAGKKSVVRIIWRMFLTGIIATIVIGMISQVAQIPAVKSLFSWFRR